MKWFRCVLALALLVALAAPEEASADRGRGGRHDSRARLGVYIGAPLYWNSPSPYYAYPGPRYVYPPYYAYPPYYTYPPPVIAVEPPPVYIERSDNEAASAREKGYWYYCYRPEGYYPDVRECPDGWERVAPTPSR